MIYHYFSVNWNSDPSDIDEIVSDQDKNDQTNSKLKLQVMQLKQQVSNLNSQLSVQSQLANNYKRKYLKRESVIKKLRSVCCRIDCEISWNSVWNKLETTHSQYT